MPERDLRAAVERWYELWNLDDKAAWLAHWRAVAPGEPAIEDPVGKPVKRGWDMVEELWDKTGRDHWKVVIDAIFVCGNEVALKCSSEGVFDGQAFSVPSVDVHQFTADSWAVRAYWDINAMTGLPYGEWTSVAGDPVA